MQHIQRFQNILCTAAYTHNRNGGSVRGDTLRQIVPIHNNNRTTRIVLVPFIHDQVPRTQNLCLTMCRCSGPFHYALRSSALRMPWSPFRMRCYLWERFAAYDWSSVTLSSLSNPSPAYSFLTSHRVLACRFPNSNIILTEPYLRAGFFFFTSQLFNIHQ